MLFQKGMKAAGVAVLLMGMMAVNAVSAADEKGEMSTVLTVSGAVKNR